MSRALAALSTLLLASVLAAPAGAAPVRYLVAIGHNQGSVGEVPLRYAERDAQEVAALLQRLGGVSPGRSVVALGEDDKAVRGAILEVNRKIRAESPPDGSVLIVYYSGHADATGLHLGGSTLPYPELEAMVEGSPATVRVLIIDSCRSGGLTRVKGVKAAPEFEIDLEQKLDAEGMAIITSSAAGEDSHESDRLRGSFFTHHLMSALRGAADANGDGRVTLDEAYSYTYHQTLRSSGKTMNLQHPTYRYDVKGRGELALTMLAAHKRRAAELVLAEDGLYLVMEGREGGPVVSELLVDRRGATVVLPPGRYFVQKRGRTQYREYSISLRAGDRSQLEVIPYREVAYARLLRKGGGTLSAVHGVVLLGGAHGPLLEGFDVAAQATLGYALDLSWLTFGLRARFSTTSGAGVAGVEGTHRSFALGLTGERFLDLPWISVGLGLLVEATRHQQAFTGAADAPDRGTWGVGFGAFVALERELAGGLSLRIEGGPVTQLFNEAPVSGGVAAPESETATPLTWHASGGLAWRF